MTSVGTHHVMEKEGKKGEDGENRMKALGMDNRSRDIVCTLTPNESDTFCSHNLSWFKKILRYYVYICTNIFYFIFSPLLLYSTNIYHDILTDLIGISTHDCC